MKLSAIILSLLLFFVFSAALPSGASAENEVMIGDVDGDGEVTVSDALNLLRGVAGLDATCVETVEVCDVSGDKLVGVEDALGILRCAIGLTGSYGYTGVELSYSLRDTSKAVGLTQNYVENAVVNEGNPARLARVMEKAARGEKINVATLGGSITEGYYSMNANTCYAGRMAAWWRENFPQSKIAFYNMGIAGTTSVLGVHRLKEDILDKNIDFLIVEFAVNDYETMTEYYENIIRRVLAEDNDMAVMMAVSTTESKWTRQKEQLPIAVAYQVPMISHHNAVWDLIDDGIYTWKELTADDTHPNELGHTIYGEIICTYLDAVKSKYERVSKVIYDLPEPVIGDGYMNARLYTSEDIEADSIGAWKVSSNTSLKHIKGGWKIEKRGKAMEFTLEFKELSLLYRKVATDANYGSVKVSVDGETTAVVDGNFYGGWGDHYLVDTVYSSDEIEEHKISLAYTGGKFELRGILVS